MPDLSHQASNEYWANFFDPNIYRIICFLESVETNTRDGNPELEIALKNLGDILEEIHFIDINQLKHEDIFIQIIANIKTSRGLRLLQAIDQAHPGSASKVIGYAEHASMSGNKVATTFIKRNLAFERLRLLSKIFSPQRLRLISKSLEVEV